MVNLLRFEETFQPTRKVLYVIHTDLPIEQDKEKREALSWLSKEMLNLPEAMRVDSLATVSYPYDDGQEVLVDPYLDYICPSNECKSDRLNVLSQPLVERRLTSPDRKALGLIGIFNIQRNSTAKLSLIAKAANDLKREFQSRYPNVEIFLTGGIPVSQAYVEAGRRDVSTLFAAAGLLIVTLLRVILGNFRITLIMLATAMAAVVVSMGIGGWLNLSINSATSTVPIIVLTLVVASAMHLFTHYLRLCGSGHQPRQAVMTAVNANYRPILLTTVTTAASLASLSFVRSPPVQELGLLAGIGIVIGGIFSITFAPLLLPTTKNPGNTVLNEWLQRKLNNFAKRLENGSRAPSVSMFALLLLALGLTSLHIDDDFVAYLSERTVVRKDTNFALEHLAGPSHIELHVKKRRLRF